MLVFIIAIIIEIFLVLYNSAILIEVSNLCIKMASPWKFWSLYIKKYDGGNILFLFMLVIAIPIFVIVSILIVLGRLFGILKPKKPRSRKKKRRKQQPETPIKIKCINCNAFNQEADKFCRGCGAILIAMIPSGIKCDNCGEMNQKSDKFCRGCGAILIAMTPSGMKCDNCGEMNQNSDKFCRGCGVVLKYIEQTPLQLHQRRFNHHNSVKTDQSSQFSICPYCGEDLNFIDVARFCPYCKKQIFR